MERRLPHLTEEAEVSARFAAQLLGCEIADGPPPPESMLAWLLERPSATSDDIQAEMQRRGLV